jgi:glycosyl transferase family 2
MTKVSGGGYGQQRSERREHAADAVGGRKVMQRNGNPRVSVVVPTRNEARNLEVVLPAIAAVRPAVHEIIIVDGNSVDGTIETAQRVLPWVKAISQTRKGKGNAMACGFAAATGDVIVMFDADGSADPAEIPAFVRALINGADFAKGSRFVRGGGSDDITLLRKSGNAGLNGVANALFGTSYTDLCYGYNAFWADILPVLDLPPIDTPAPADGNMLWGDGFEIETVLNCRVAAAGLKITEVPSMERERIFGQTNLRTFADGTRVLRTLAAERRRASRGRAERVQVEEQARALTPVGGIPVVPPAPQPVLTPPSPSPTAPVNGSRGGHVNGQANGHVNGQVNGQVANEVSAPAEPVERRPMPQARVESQPRVEGPVRETRDGVSLRLALEEEAS